MTRSRRGGFRRPLRGAVVCSLGAAVGVALAAAPARAQRSKTRRVVPVRASLSTPVREELTPEVLSRLQAPPGFRVSVFAQGLGAPRMLAVGDDGTVYVTRRDSGDVLALRDVGGRADGARKVVADVRGVHGVVLHGGRMYLATVKEVYVADLRPDGGVGTPRRIIADLPDGGQHPNRTIGVGPDGMLYISVGSTCNQCVETNEESAAILRASPDGARRGVFARGLRNTIGFDWHPRTGEMWGMDHGFDWRGDDLPPEELNRIQPAANYGWPFCYAAKIPDRTYAVDPHGATKEEFCALTVAPALTYTAHSAPIGLAFYRGSQFPERYRDDAFVALRGSWNREPPSGYKIVRVHFEDGKPVKVEDFVTGFLARGGQSYLARLAGVAIAKDGALLVSDDANGVIYRVAYQGETKSAQR